MIHNANNAALYIGDAITARDLALIYNYEIACVVDLAANELPACLGRDIAYCRFPLSDDDSNADWLIESAIACVHGLLECNVRTLVACSAGMSRSPVIAAAALARMTGAPLADSLRSIVDGAPHDVSPSLLISVQRAYDDTNVSGGS